jgi:hypothetical protein
MEPGAYADNQQKQLIEQMARETSSPEEDVVEDVIGEIVKEESVDEKAVSDTTGQLADRGFTTFPIHLLSQSANQISSLDLSHNPFDPVHYLTAPLSLPYLKSLSIVSTGVTTLDALCTYLSAPQLTELNISCHRLSGPLPRIRDSFPKLSILLATDNWFSELPLKSILGLTVVDLRNNFVKKGSGDDRKDWDALGCEVRL